MRIPVGPLAVGARYNATISHVLVTRSAAAREKLSKADYEAQVEELRLELLNAQFDLRHSNFSLPILLTGIDRPAIESTYQLLHEWFDARYIDANSGLEPTAEERERPFVWRYSQMIPPNGRIGLFLDGWVKDLIGHRLLGEIDQAKYDQRLREVQVFTRALVDDGHVPLRFFFNCRLKRSTQHKHQNVLLEFQTPASCGAVRSAGERSCPGALVSVRTSRFPWGSTVSTDRSCSRSIRVAKGSADHRSTRRYPSPG
jgi:hypothetical protein